MGLCRCRQQSVAECTGIQRNSGLGKTAYLGLGKNLRAERSRLRNATEAGLETRCTRFGVRAIEMNGTNIKLNFVSFWDPNVTKLSNRCTTLTVSRSALC